MSRFRPRLSAKARFQTQMRAWRSGLRAWLPTRRWGFDAPLPRDFARNTAHRSTPQQPMAWWQKLGECSLQAYCKLPPSWGFSNVYEAYSFNDSKPFTSRPLLNSAGRALPVDDATRLSGRPQVSAWSYAGRGAQPARL